MTLRAGPSIFSASETELPFLEFVYGVNALAFSPDGQFLAGANTEGNIIFWEVATSKEAFRLTGHRGSVQSIAFNLEGTNLVSGGRDKTVRIWDLVKGQVSRTLVRQNNEIYAVAFHPDGRLVANGSINLTPAEATAKKNKADNLLPIPLWNVVDGQELKSLVGHTGNINALAFSPDGKKLASGSSDKTIKLWDIETGQELVTMLGYPTAVSSVIYSSDGQILASSGGRIILRNAESGEIIKIL
jgi:WD40 repeat protein